MPGTDTRTGSDQGPAGSAAVTMKFVAPVRADVRRDEPEAPVVEADGRGVDAE